MNQFFFLFIIFNKIHILNLLSGFGSFIITDLLRFLRLAYYPFSDSDQHPPSYGFGILITFAAAYVALQTPVKRN